MKILKYKRICKYCDVCFETSSKHGKVCEICKEKNHQKKIMKSIFNGNDKSL